jgi:hypothetical protein
VTSLALTLISLLLAGAALYTLWALLSALGVDALSITAAAEQAFTLPMARWAGLGSVALLLAGIYGQVPELYRQLLAAWLFVVALVCSHAALLAPARRWRAVNEERRWFLGAAVVVLALLCPAVLMLAALAFMGRQLLARVRQPLSTRAGFLIRELIRELGQLLAPITSAIRYLASALCGCLTWILLLLNPHQAAQASARRDTPSIVAPLLVVPALAPRAPPVFA